MTTASNTPGDTLPLHVALRSPLSRAALAAARPILAPLLGLSTLDTLYRESRSAQPGTCFTTRALQALGIRFRVHAAAGARIPASGPLIVAANHPTGILDGLVLAETVRQVRSDVRILTNHVLAAIPELRDLCFFVDPFAGRGATGRSRPGLRAAHAWLQEGGTLLTFPAGEVAWRCAGEGVAAESEWLPAVGRLAQATGAGILPAHIRARNSRLFYAAGRVHPLLRTLLLGRELLNKRGATIEIRIGHVRTGTLTMGATGSSPERLADAARLTSAVRLDVDELARDHGTRQAAAIAPPADPALLHEEVRGLPEGNRVLSSGEFDVFYAAPASIPRVLREIGRLRETTFRAVGEGTGQRIDLDRFDRHYQHLFVWHRVRRQVVGAYRIGATDRILPALGVPGLYTSTLFDYDPALLERLGPALELGRSFVRAEYQRTYNALLLLWKGIGQVIARSPRYRMLFGPVSISSRYQDLSQQMLRAFLAQERTDTTLAALVQPRNPPPPVTPPARDAVARAGIGDLDALIAQIEGHPRGMPVLLRQYLRLDATLLAFNIDPAFRDALDALMLVDLARLPAATLRRYLAEGAEGFLAVHKTAPTRAA